jgi:hypothetical protein
VSRKNRVRVEGAVQVGKAVARKIPLLNDLETAKDLAEGTYKAVKGERIRTPTWFLSFGERMDREEARKEREHAAYKCRGKLFH